MGETGK